MADVDEADAVLAQPPDHAEEDRDFRRVERRRRLVHDDEPGIERYRARERDHLLYGDPEAHDGYVEIDRHAERLHDARGFATHLAPIQMPESQARLATEKDVLGGREIRNQIHFLVDRRDAGALSGARRRERHGPAVQVDLSTVTRVGARKDFDQRRFARAVMSDERVHFTGGDGEIDSGERLYARKMLRDAAHLEQCRLQD